jgi:TatD DNase family protein
LTIAPWYHPNGEGADGSGRRPRLPDTHAHLDAPVFKDREVEVVERALEAGVDRILAVGSDLASSQNAVALAQRFESVYAAVGIHPHEAGRFSQDAVAVRSLIVEKKVVAVGEIGLDYRRGLDTRTAQLEAFREQLAWAKGARLPVSIHNRDADDAIMLELRGTGVVAVLHCFSSSQVTARRALEDGHYFSFAGNVTFPKAQDLREVAVQIPSGRLLVETDSPVLAPQPWRGKVNEPEHVTATAQVLADVRGEPISQFCADVSATADRVFRWRDE